MSQSLRQRQALGKAGRVFCDRDLKPGRDEPTVLRVQPPARDQPPSDQFDPKGFVPLGLLIVLLIYIVGVTVWTVATLPAPTW